MPKLFVKNFLNIREVELDMDKTFVVLIGETASGKSVLIKLIYLFQEIVEDFRLYVRRIHKHSMEHLKPDGYTFSKVLHAHVSQRFRDIFGDTVQPLHPRRKGKTAGAEKPDTESAVKIQPFEIIYHYTPESAIRLTSDAEGVLQIELPAVMDEVEAIGLELIEELKEEHQRRRRRLPSAALRTVRPEDAEDPFDDIDTPDEGTPEAAVAEAAAEAERKKSPFYSVLTLALALNKITEKVAGNHRDALFIPSDRTICANYPDPMKRLFYGGIKSDINTRMASESRANLHLIARFMEKNEELLDMFNLENFEGLLEERVGEIEHTYPRIFKFLQEKTAAILKDKVTTADTFTESMLFFDPNNKQAAHLELASAGQQHTIRMLQDIFVAVFYIETVFRAIEEPEAYLHPTAQRDFLHILTLLRSHTNSQIVLTTHSPYVLAVLKRLLTAGRRGKRDPAAAEANAGVPDFCWLLPEEVEVYHIVDGQSHSLMRRKSKAVLQNPLADLLKEF